MPKPKPERKTKRERRGRGEGTVWQKPDGTWRGQISQGGSGRLRRRTSYAGDTKAEVVDAIARGRTQQVDGLLPSPEVTTVGQYLAHWVEAVKDHVSGASVDAYDRRLKHLSPLLGHIRLQKLTAAQIQSALNTLATTASRRDVLTALRIALGHAVEQGALAVNPCDRIKQPRPPKAEMQYLDAGQAAALLKAVKGHPFEPIYVLAIGTGARISELLALRWEDIDEKRKTLSIRRTLSKVKKEIIVKPPKNGKGRRLQLDARSTAAIQDQKRIGLAGGIAGQPWLFCRPGGEWLDRGTVARALTKILADAKLPDIRFHDLRHTNCVLLLLAGVNARVVSERLGHASVAFTLEKYGHVLPAMEADAVAKLDKLLAEENTEAIAVAV